MPTDCFGRFRLGGPGHIKSRIKRKRTAGRELAKSSRRANRPRKNVRKSRTRRGLSRSMWPRGHKRVASSTE